MHAPLTIDLSALQKLKLTPEKESGAHWNAFWPCPIVLHNQQHAPNVQSVLAIQQGAFHSTTIILLALGEP